MWRYTKLMTVEQAKQIFPDNVLCESCSSVLGVPTVHSRDSHASAARIQEVTAEMKRQLIDGLLPSEGLPDIRPNYPRYEKESEN